jgi:hypothetical protein
MGQTQVTVIRHGQVDMGAWDEGSEDVQWPSEEKDIDREEETYMRGIEQDFVDGTY